jgi:hypothetical protein
LNSVPLTILEWLVTVPDYPHSQFFTQSQGISNTTIELQTVNTNFAIAMKWARNYILHITQVLHPNTLEYVFQQTPDSTTDIEIWQPPIQPDIVLFKNETKYNTQNNYWWSTTSKRNIQRI